MRSPARGPAHAPGPAGVTTRPAAGVRPAGAAPPVSNTARPTVTAGPAPRSDTAEYGAMQRELQVMRRMLETGLAGMTWNDKRLREPLRARVLEELTAMDIAPDVALTLAELTPHHTTLHNPSPIPLPF